RPGAPEQPLEVRERGDARVRLPVGRVLEGVRDAKQQVRDHDLAPGRLREDRNRQREGTAGLLEEIVEIRGPHRIPSGRRLATKAATRSAPSTTTRRIRRRRGIEPGCTSAASATAERRMPPSESMHRERYPGSSSSAVSVTTRTIR